jgi:2,4-dienoyl-CoA reductase-like NADH-dependent reductase (Old Yellow Enzyme family)/thioredoxin reductase
MRFQKLFEPLSLSELQLPNRVAMPPITTNYASKGFITDRMVDFYAERARGGAALIIMEDCIVEAPRGRHTASDTFICDDIYISGLRRIAEAMKEHGARAGIQLNHGGRAAGRVRQGQLLLTEGQIPVAPSPITRSTTGYVIPKALTIEEIEEIEDKYAEAAWRAKEAGFELISLHCTHGYLIEQFLSPYSNKRQDAYGGDSDKRFRFLSEIIQKVKNRIGNDFPLMCRISGEELVEGGLTLEDARKNAKKLEAAGVHCISVSVSGRGLGNRPDYLEMPVSSSPMRSQRGTLVYLASAVKDVLSIPVMTANRIITPDLGEQILQQGKADIIGIGRGLVADPEWPIKSQDGRTTEIRHCISCELCLPVGPSKEPPLKCAINPVAGREGEFKITPTSQVKKVFIAGGGPAGLEAGRVAALRGHKVFLYEKNIIGGQLNLACIPPGRNEIKMFVDFERDQLDRLGVEIKHQELTLDIIRQEQPDTVIIATGAYPKSLEIPGNDNKKVISAWDALRGDIPQGKVLIIGGKQIGAETAEFLASRGIDVTLVEESDMIARDIAHLPLSHGFLLLSLSLLKVTILTKTKIEEITEPGAIANQKGKHITIAADSVVVALGSKSDRTLASQLETMGIEFHLAGDCEGIGRLYKAVKQGFLAGLAV